MSKVIEFPKPLSAALDSSLPAKHAEFILWCFERQRASRGVDSQLFALIAELAKADHEWSAALADLNEFESAEPRPSGWLAAKQKCEEIDDHIFQIETKIASINATTLDGLIAKAQAARMPSYRSDEIGASIVEDLLQLGRES